MRRGSTIIGRRAWMGSVVLAVCGPGMPRLGAQGLPYPPEMAGARAEVYKTAGDTKLRLYIFDPPDGPAQVRAAIVFFFGGGWRAGSPQQFRDAVPASGVAGPSGGHGGLPG